MNYYSPRVDNTLYLYDKANHKVIRTFNGEGDLAIWMSMNLYRYRDAYEGQVNNLTMDFLEPEPVYRPMYFKGNGYLRMSEGIAGYKKNLVILCNVKCIEDSSIYNYTLVLNDVMDCIENGNQISTKGYASGQLRSMWDRIKIKNLPEFRRGSVPGVHKRSVPSSSHLIVNKAERSVLFSKDIDTSVYIPETDSFEEYDIPRIKSLRNSRKALCGCWEEGYTRQHNNERWKHSASWKNTKKKAQWM